MLELDLPPNETITFKHYHIIIQRVNINTLYKKSEGIGLVKESHENNHKLLEYTHFIQFFIVNLF